MTYVNGMCQYALYDVRMPQHTLVFLRLNFTGLIEVSGRRKNTGIVEPASNLYHADTLRAPFENLTDGRSRFLIDNKVVFVIGIFAVPIGCPRSDELATLLFNVKCRCGFLGYIFTVNLVDEIFQRHDISVLGSLCGQRIKIIVDGDEANTEEWENAFQIVSGLLVVTTEAGQVFDDDAVHTPFCVLPPSSSQTEDGQSPFPFARCHRTGLPAPYRTCFR